MPWWSTDSDRRVIPSHVNDEHSGFREAHSELIRPHRPDSLMASNEVIVFRLISPVVVGCLGAFRISTCTAVANEVHEDDMP